MQAVIMAAGKGSRLKEGTKDKPKPMAKVCGKPMVDWILDEFAAVGIGRVVMVVGYKREQLQEHLRSRDIVYVYNPFYAFGQVLSSFWFALNQINMEQDLLFCHADTIFESKILERVLATEGDIVLPYDTRDCGEEEMKVRLDTSGNIIELSKTMDLSHSQGEFIGLALIRRSKLRDLVRVSRSIIDEGGLDAYFEAALQRMKEKKIAKLAGLDVTGLQWNEIDFQEDLDAANSFNWKF